MATPGPNLNAPGFGAFEPAIAFDTASDWSSTETVTLPANVPLSSTPAPSSSTSTLTPTPISTSTSVSSASYTSLLKLIALVVIAFLLAVIIFLLL